MPLDLRNLATQKALAKKEAVAVLVSMCRETSPAVEGMFVIMVRQLAIARVLEERLLSVMSEVNQQGRHAKEINEKMLELAGEIARELTAEANANVERARRG